MELIYSMRRKPLKCEPPHFESLSDPEVVKPLCTISTANIIAFSSPTELCDVDGDTWGGHVYICDLDTPWDAHKVASIAFPVSALEWDSEGKQLLIASTEGEVSVYRQKDHLLNQWTCVYSANFPGEHIIKASFFHNGRRVVVSDKKPDALLTDRLQLLRPAPTLKGFGGIACEGVIVMTATGIVCTVTPPAEGTRAHTMSECLRPSRDHVTAATIAHKKGSVVTGAVCVGGAGRACVRCCLLVVEAASLVLQPLPAIYLADPVPPACIAWWVREDADSLLVAGSTLTLWKCTERAHPVHKLLAKGTLQNSSSAVQKPDSDCFNTVSWVQTAAWPVEGRVSAGVCCARSPPAAPLAVLATPRALHLLARDSHAYLCSRPVTIHGPKNSEDGATPPKKNKYSNGTTHGGSVSCVELSALGGVVVCIDSLAQLHVYRLPHHWPETPVSSSLQHACWLLEYALVSGCDCLDVLLTLPPTLVEPLYDRLTESFQRQPAPLQQYYYHSWLKLRIALCRLIPSLECTAACLTSVQALQGAWAACAAALRPDEKPDHPAIDEHALEHDKNLVALETKSEVLSEAAALSPLRACLQRALDTAATVLLAVAHQHHPCESWWESSSVSVLRRLVVVARCAGRGGEPLSRPLARLQLHPPAHKDLLEECLTAGGGWSAPRVWESLPRCSISAPHQRHPPFYLEYGVEPEALRYIPEPPAYIQCETTPSLAMDAIRYMYLGGGSKPARWRQCSRCGARALPAAQPARHPLQKAYDNRFLANCRCGGKWTLFSNM